MHGLDTIARMNREAAEREAAEDRFASLRYREIGEDGRVGYLTRSRITGEVTWRPMDWSLGDPVTLFDSEDFVRVDR